MQLQNSFSIAKNSSSRNQQERSQILFYFLNKEGTLITIFRKAKVNIKVKKNTNPTCSVDWRHLKKMQRKAAKRSSPFAEQGTCL